MNSKFLSSPVHLGYVGLAVIALLNFSSSSLKAQPAPVNPPQPIVAPAASAPSPAPAQFAPPNQAAPTEDIRDIRGPKPIPSSEALILELLAAGLFVALACAAWFWYRRSRLAAKLPYEIALERLEKARGLMQPDMAREFSIEVSEVIRSYTETRFQVLATHRTTEEFLHDLLEPSDALLANHRELLGDFLEHCDLAKFARWELSVQDMDRMLQSARTFVTQTGQPTPAKPAKSLQAQS